MLSKERRLEQVITFSCAAEIEADITHTPLSHTLLSLLKTAWVKKTCRA